MDADRAALARLAGTDKFWDAVHGSVEGKAYGPRIAESLPKLLSSAVLTRLRGVKQLGFASLRYLSADHTRLSHALGSLHVMSQIVDHLRSRGRLVSAAQLKELRAAFPGVAASAPSEAKRAVADHLLVAALLQDIGELPHEEATRHLFEPSTDLKSSTASEFDFDLRRSSGKHVFTLALLSDARLTEALQDFSIPFLVFLITGEVAGREAGKVARLRALRHLLDGVIDADRLDYVFRDSYHTIGGRGTPTDIITAIDRYDELGPVFLDADPVMEFLALRSRMWWSVYLDPSKRVWSLFLLAALREVASVDLRLGNPRAARIELDVDDFLLLDDHYLTTWLVAAQGDSAIRRQLSKRCNFAIEALVGPRPAWEWRWLAVQNDPPTGKIPRLPDTLFADTYAGINEHRLFEAKSVRIQASQHGSDPQWLEDCVGPLGMILRDQWMAHPLPGHVAVFVPGERPGRGWPDLADSTASAEMHQALVAHDPIAGFDVPLDTREMRGFSGPSIFISFAHHDRFEVRELAAALFEKKRRYFLLMDRFDGLGETAKNNSVAAVDKADWMLVVVSSNYVDRWAKQPDGNLAAEVIRAITRRQGGDLGVVCVSLDDYQDVKEGLPWSHLTGRDGIPFVGEALRGRDRTVYGDAIDSVLSQIANSDDGA